LGNSNSVLITGYQENPFKFISRSDVYVLSSLFEGFPNAMVEAMACGCPVIATDCKSGPKEILYENANLDNISTSIEKADYGLLVPPLDSKENWDSSMTHNTEEILANAMLMYINDKKLCESYALKAAARSKVFSYERCKREFEGVINGNPTILEEQQ